MSFNNMIYFKNILPKTTQIFSKSKNVEQKLRHLPWGARPVARVAGNKRAGGPAHVLAHVPPGLHQHLRAVSGGRVERERTGRERPRQRLLISSIRRRRVFISYRLCVQQRHWPHPHLHFTSIRAAVKAVVTAHHNKF